MSEGGAGMVVSCEVDYRSQGIAVLVVPALKRVTVGVELDGAGGASGRERGSWLIGGEGSETVVS